MPKKIFDEKKYQKTKSHLKKAGIIVIIVSLIIGALLIIPPIVNINRAESNQSKVLIDTDEVSIIPKDNDVPMTQAEYDAAVTAIETENDAKLQAEISAIRTEYAAKDYSMWGSRAEVIRTQDIDFEISKATSSNEFDKTAALNELKFEWDKAKSEHQFYNNPIFKLANTMFNFTFSLINKVTGNVDNQTANNFSILMIIPGITVIVIGCGIGLILILASNGRGILGFIAQTVAPVGKETIEYTAPAYGKAAKEISKGWISGKIAATKKKTVKKKKK